MSDFARERRFKKKEERFFGDKGTIILDDDDICKKCEFTFLFSFILLANVINEQWYLSRWVFPHE